MRSTSEFLLKVMRILAWIVFVGLLVKAGALIMSYGVSINNAEAAKDMYRGMDLSRYEAFSFVHYTMIVSYHIILYILQAYIALFATHLLKSINLEKPFTKIVSNLLQKISVVILVVWLLSIVYNIHVTLLERYEGITAELFSGEYIFLAGMLYVLAQLFKRGVVMQNENELTV